jgi:hypothetical protein
MELTPWLITTGSVLRLSTGGLIIRYASAFILPLANYSTNLQRDANRLREWWLVAGLSQISCGMIPDR